jgi:hypothetical protein
MFMLSCSTITILRRIPTLTRHREQNQLQDYRLQHHRRNNIYCVQCTMYMFLWQGQVLYNDIPNCRKGWRRASNPETHTKRQANQHGCLPTAQLAGRWGQRNWNSVWWGKKLFCTGPTRAAKAEQNIFYRHDKPNEPTKDGPLSFVLSESPYTSVSTVSRGHPFL